MGGVQGPTEAGGEIGAEAGRGLGLTAAKEPRRPPQPCGVRYWAQLGVSEGTAERWDLSCSQQLSLVKKAVRSYASPEKLITASESPRPATAADEET